MPRRSPRRTLLPWAFLPYIVMSIIHVIARAVESDAAGPTKLWLMPLLALPVLVSLRARPALAIALLLIALLFSWLGDGAGAFFPAGPELPLMLLFFGLAHVAYIVLFTRVLGSGRLPRWTAVFAVWWIAMIAVLGPHTGGLLPAVGAYGLILGATAALAARCGPVVTTGGVFFLVSDTILAFRLFLPDAAPGWTSPLVMLTYTLGQGLLVGGALLVLRRRARG
ncbi:hypothetical protein HD600_000181 [Microbacterium ginsengiterrae]|uniref:Membrane protein YhhN n=1 Tax=Microbacterium ginsengiterrae TaxID=546115 RepID=A0A7W9C9T8_9MICO|nr:lysoplasmalogenase family protein [Microbacterium ginsengiterrae]MBB5741684.1 hypothetical protein [Microbacterium ginsengiterrae]